MINFRTYNIYNEYINTLVRNQNNTNIESFLNMYSKKDYERLLKPVLEIIRQNPNASLTTLRFLLFSQSGIKELIDNFINQTQITPGIILDFGTFNTRDTVLCGKSSEYIWENNSKKVFEKPIEQDTIFDLASTSKLFTSLAILKLAELNLIDIYDPITKYVPQFKKLNNVTIYDLIKFRVMIVTDKRVDAAKTKEEAENILFGVHPKDNQIFSNAYTDMGAMVLRYVVEAASKVSFHEFISENILKPANMKDTHLNVPEEKLSRVANENFSTIINAKGEAITRTDTTPGIPQDPKTLAIGAKEGIAPGHAGYFSTKDDMVKLAKALINKKILSNDSLLSMSDTATGFNDLGEYTFHYGSLVYLKQPDPKKLSVYPSLSGRSFMSPGYAGTTLVIDPLNEITLFVGAPRLHNRIHQIHPNFKNNIIINEHNKKTYLLPNNEEMIVSSDYTKAKEVMVALALDLSFQYQLLEKIYPTEKEMHLVRELN